MGAVGQVVVGSSQGRRVGGAGLVAVAVSFGMGRQGYGLFVPVFREQFGLSLSAVGLLASAAYVGYLVSVVSAGVLTARRGPRLPVLIGCGVAAAGTALVAAASTMSVLGVGVVLAGASAGWTWAPFSDAVPQLVPLAGQDRALAWVNAGTPFGLTVAAGAALMAGASWRWAWGAFAVLAVIAGLVNLRVLSRGERSTAPEGGAVGWRWFVDRQSVPLFVSCFGLSFAISAYWTFAPDVVSQAGLPVWAGAALWALLGVTGGLVGVRAGDLVARTVFTPLLASSLVALAGGMGLLAAAPGSWPAVLTSAAVFGAAFTTAFALIVLWSQRVFPLRPSTGFSATILCSAAGFVLGPALFGLAADRWSPSAALGAAAVLTLTVVLSRPSPTTRAHWES